VGRHQILPSRVSGDDLFWLWLDIANLICVSVRLFGHVDYEAGGFEKTPAGLKGKWLAA
jgi:hypothetical protein